MLSDSSNVISPGCLYLVRNAQKRLQLGVFAFRKMRREGLRILYVAGRAYVLGDDLIAFFKQRASVSGRAASEEKG